MNNDKPYTVSLKFPGDLEHIPPIRKFVSELLQVNQFSPKFAYRSEIIVDEICNNAVSYGCNSSSSHVTLFFRIYTDRLELEVQDEGGRIQDINRLRTAVKKEERDAGFGLDDLKRADSAKGSLGLEIVRMLSEEISLNIDENNITSIRVVRRREDVDETEAS